MTKRAKAGFCGPSDEWINRLSKGGCPMDRTITSKLRSRGQTRPFLLRSVCGDCRVFDISHLGGTGYELGMRIEALRSRGIIISDWWFTPPWSDHFVSWGLEPRRPIGYWNSTGEAPSDQELLAVLDDRRPVTPAKPVEGWLYGQSNESIPDEVQNHSSVFGELTVAAEGGAVARMKIRLHVNRSAKTVRAEICKRGSLFSQPDPVPISGEVYPMSRYAIRT